MSRERAWHSATALVLALPWLNPFASGPSPGTFPLLFSWACAALVILVWGRIKFDDILWSWIVAGGVSSAIALFQYAGWSELLTPWINSTRPGEAFANLRQRNQFASLCNMGLAALWWWTLDRRISGEDRRILWGWIALATALLVAGNAASSSRTGALQLIVLAGLAMCCAWRLKARGIILLTCAALVGYAMLAFSMPLILGLEPGSHGLFARLAQGDRLCASRITLWANVIDLIRLRPWLGWGWGELDFAHYVTLYEGPRFCDILDNAHNLPLHLAVELGLPLTTMVMAGAVWLCVKGKPWRERAPTRQLAWIILVIIGMHSLLEYPLWYGPFQIAALSCAAHLLHLPANAQEERGVVSKWGRGAASLVLLITLFTGWDYRRVSQIYLAPEQRATAYREDTLNKIKGSWIFRRQVQFAELTTTTLQASNARQLHDAALALIHFSPEPRVIEKLIESSFYLGLKEEAAFHMVRYKVAFPLPFEAWIARAKKG